MSVTFTNYNPDPLFGKDYHRLRDLLVRLDNHNYHFGRWDWMITHTMLEKDSLSKIGLWEDNGMLVAVATYDCIPGQAFLLHLPDYEYLKEDMLLYAKDNLQKDGKFQVIIRDGDTATQAIAARHGFCPTQQKESEAVYPIGPDPVTYDLPEGFSIVSMKDHYDLRQYGQILWKGFNHEAKGEGPFIFKDEELPAWRLQFERPNTDLNLKIAVVAPNGDFVSYCGMWQDNNSQSALVEPVATDPAYRKMGLGRAAVLEAVRRCGMLGAKRAFVGSSQQFYYRIGFRPYAVSTWWEQQ